MIAASCCEGTAFGASAPRTMATHRIPAATSARCTGLGGFALIDGERRMRPPVGCGRRPACTKAPFFPADTADAPRCCADKTPGWPAQMAPRTSAVLEFCAMRPEEIDQLPMRKSCQCFLAPGEHELSVLSIAPRVVPDDIGEAALVEDSHRVREFLGGGVPKKGELGPPLQFLRPAALRVAGPLLFRRQGDRDCLPSELLRPPSGLGERILRRTARRRGRNRRSHGSAGRGF